MQSPQAVPSSLQTRVPSYALLSHEQAVSDVGLQKEPLGLESEQAVDSNTNPSEHKKHMEEINLIQRKQLVKDRKLLIL